MSSERPTGGEALDALMKLADAVRDVMVARENTEQLRLRVGVERARIEATRDFLMSYLERTFDERRDLFGSLFARLDAAMAADQHDVASTTIDAIVELGTSSPFKALADLTAARAALNDDETKWEF